MENKVVFVSGKGATGKSTFAKTFKGYYLISLDEIIRISVAKRLGITENKKIAELFNLYKVEECSELILKAKEIFVEFVREEISKHYQVIVEGTIKDNGLIKKIFEGYEFTFYYMKPKTMEEYEMRIKQRFIESPDIYGRLGFLEKSDKDKKALLDFKENGIDGKVISNFIRVSANEQYKIIEDLYQYYAKEFSLSICN